jgi:hypothetical protein
MQVWRNLTSQLARCWFNRPGTPRNAALTVVSPVHFESELLIDKEVTCGRGDRF